jgi:hypothetical protein
MFRPTNLVFSVNGARPSESAYTLDGGLNMDTYNNVPAAFRDPDSLEEFSMPQNSYSAVYGRNVGVVVNMTTKSGTNEFHGTLDEFLRNMPCEARTAEKATNIKRVRTNMATLFEMGSMAVLVFWYRQAIIGHSAL